MISSFNQKGFPGGSPMTKSTTIKKNNNNKKNKIKLKKKKNPPTKQETWVWSVGQEDALEKEMATHSSVLAWEIPWIEEFGGL